MKCEIRSIPETALSHRIRGIPWRNCVKQPKTIFARTICVKTREWRNVFTVVIEGGKKTLLAPLRGRESKILRFRVSGRAKSHWFLNSQLVHASPKSARVYSQQPCRPVAPLNSPGSLFKDAGNVIALHLVKCLCRGS